MIQTNQMLQKRTEAELHESIATFITQHDEVYLKVLNMINDDTPAPSFS